MYSLLHSKNKVNFIIVRFYHFYSALTHSSIYFYSDTILTSSLRQYIDVKTFLDSLFPKLIEVQCAMVHSISNSIWKVIHEDLQDLKNLMDLVNFQRRKNVLLSTNFVCVRPGNTYNKKKLKRQLNDWNKKMGVKISKYWINWK